jgi:hypothetical protein
MVVGGFAFGVQPKTAKFAVLHKRAVQLAPVAQDFGKPDKSSSRQVAVVRAPRQPFTCQPASRPITRGCWASGTFSSRGERYCTESPSAAQKLFACARRRVAFGPLDFAGARRRGTVLQGRCRPCNAGTRRRPLTFWLG